MADIRMHASKYVPVNAQETTDKVTGKKIAGDKVHTLLFGGDQLTRKRAAVAIELNRVVLTLWISLRVCNLYVKISMLRKV